MGKWQPWHGILYGGLTHMSATLLARIATTELTPDECQAISAILEEAEELDERPFVMEEGWDELDLDI